MFNLPADISVPKLKDVLHPAVEAHTEGWTVALDAYDGEGGFLDGSYIWRFAREKQDEFESRASQARYHNYQQTIVDYYTRKVCSEISRETTNQELIDWLGNVDGAGTDMSTLIRRALSKALAAGHVGLLADKTPDVPTGPSKADERASVFVAQFLPQSILDWRLAQDETITSVKLLETVIPQDLIGDEDEKERILLWDQDEWVRVIGEGTDDDTVQVTRQKTGLGLVPLVILRPFRSARWSLIGKALIEPSLLLALYNRGSEQDNVLREQGFSLFVVQLPATGEVDVKKAREALGDEVGATRAVFAYGGATYQTPSMDVPATQQDHQQYLIQELYRLAHIPHDLGSKDAQTAEAIKLTHEELEAVLSGVASECARVEEALVKLWCAWQSATPEAAEALFEAAQFSVRYPESFFEADPEVEIKTLVAAMNAVPSPTLEKVIQKQIVSLVASSLDEETRETIDAEIDAGEAERPDPLAALAEEAGNGFGGGARDDEQEAA